MLDILKRKTMDAIITAIIIKALDQPNRNNQIKAVYDLLKKAYNDGITKGREQAINQIFTSHPDDDEQFTV